MVQWISANLHIVISILMIISEGAAAVVQLLYPSNQGFSGVLQSIIKFLQSLDQTAQASPDKK